MPQIAKTTQLPRSPRVISYIRFSTIGQALGDSERRQLERAEAWCAEQKPPLTLAPNDVLRGLGVSAYRGTHRREGAFADFLAAVRAGAIARGTVLIVEAWDRLSREPPVRALNQMAEIILAGIKVVTLVDKQEHDEETVNAQPHRLFHSLAMIISANAESVLKSDRVAKSWEGRRKSAATGAIMTKTRKAWLEVIDGKFVPNAGAKTVHRIFEMIAAGMGCYKSARTLQAEYLKTGKPAPLSGDKKSGGWNKSRIHALIHDDAVMGVFSAFRRGKDGKTRVFAEKIEGYYPVVVQQSLVNRAREQLKGRNFGGTGAGARGKLYANLLSGIAKCGICGSSMYLIDRNSRRMTPGALRCSNAYERHGCTNTKSIPYPAIEELVLNDVAWFQVARKQVPRHDPSQELAEQIAEKQGASERINATLAAMTDRFGDNPLPALVAQMTRLAERQDAIEGELAELRQQHQLAISMAEQPDLLSEKDTLVAQAVSVDPQIRYEARSRIASALRGTITTIKCMPDKTVEMVYPTIQLPEPSEPAKTWQARYIPDAKVFEFPITVAAEPDGPRTITFRTVYDGAVRHLMDFSHPTMTFDITNAGGVFIWDELKKLRLPV